ncbi:ammonium transporter [Enterococcus montenegrensis]|uniref:ammonium transporter n=1 Tax=Enterococcus montenegrensis TaxID=3031993 RepID=UPI00249DFCB9|nr:ammonium transporter [Enterococcus montenegrensis]WHA08680.1 ammonium transporter [Enterococcus montenegrensis]
MNTGNIAFIIICTGLVFIMTPALAFFYGGLSRQKNILNTMMMSICTLGLASVIWILIGYSLSFSGTGLFIGNLDKLFFQHVSMIKGDGIPEGLFAAFQMMFALITSAILTGSVAGRMRFSAIFLFLAVWLVVVYAPMAHMVWGGGFLDQIGSVDFAGGNVVHISSGISGLVLAIVLGKRKEVEHIPHNIPFIVLGTGLLWLGWFGFNAGSALAADGLAIHALLTTNTAAAAAMLSWMGLEKLVNGKPSIVGACTGAVVGLVAITPGAGFISMQSALLTGVLVSPVCYYGIRFVKEKLGFDDALDAFGCHGIGGIFGGIITGIFADPSVGGRSGLIFGQTDLFVAQLLSIVITIAFAGTMSFIIISIIKKFIPLRVSELDELQGMDQCEHNEEAYNTTLGLDLD